MNNQNAKYKLIEKMKWGKCLFCQTKTLKNELASCPYDNCPVFDLCEKCMEEHTKGHIKNDTHMDDEVITLLNSLNGSFRKEKGNKTGLW